jgi:acyl-coenzyme A thioesterase PaaI-like protein
MASQLSAIRLWSKLNRTSFGHWLFSRIVCFKAPYFASVSPRISILEKNLCEGMISQRRSIQNHLGTIHAIALCNLAELCAGLMTDVSIPSEMRWIPKEMKVKYLKKALGKITARAVPAKEFYVSEEGYTATVNVTLCDAQAVEVFHAEIQMWLSKRT